MKFFPVFLFACAAPSIPQTPDLPECPHQCSAVLADRCTDDGCFCGALPPCEHPEACRFGTCYAPQSGGELCEFDDQCALYEACIGGACRPIDCGPETCNGVDDDCDGTVDYLARPCGEVPCAGTELCISGEWTDCRPPQGLPSEQGVNRCNNLDDDCDGEVDEGRNVGVDIVFVVDVSPSMFEEIDSVLAAVSDFAATVGNESTRFALVTVGVHPEGVPRVESDLVEVLTILPYFSGLFDINSSWMEPTRDAVLMLGNGELPLSWRIDSARVLLVFTDEVPQSYRDPIVTERDMCAALTHGEGLFVFTPLLHAQAWNDCAATYSINRPEELAAIAELFEDPCLNGAL